jgi:hypothetical protein
MEAFLIALSVTRPCPPPPLLSGIVSGFQSSLQASFEMVSFLAGLQLHAPTQFHWLMLGSVALVGIAFLLYTSFAARAGCAPATRRQPDSTAP